MEKVRIFNPPPPQINGTHDANLVEVGPIPRYLQRVETLLARQTLFHSFFATQPHLQIWIFPPQQNLSFTISLQYSGILTVECSSSTMTFYLSNL